MASGAGLSNVREVEVDEASLADTFRRDILEGLGRSPKRTEPKHLYDARGSELFEGITRAADYYPTRTERSIYEGCAGEIAGVIEGELGEGVVLIEPGSGSGEKAEWVLDALGGARAFVPIEISMSALVESAERIGRKYPGLEVVPACADFTATGHVPSGVPAGPRVVFFPGSTIGNLEPDERAAVLASFRRVAGEGGMLLIGTDLEKDADVLERAYDDSEGVTAAFDLNLLERINRELGGGFDVGSFRHEARWNDGKKRVEMHLVSEADQEVRVNGESFSFGAGETIHTECSHKFTAEGFDGEAREAGFERVEAWTDEKGWYRVALYRGV
jgi:dimethylhistidine N-methyltransferase